MAGTVAKTEHKSGSVKMIKLAWTSTAGGAASTPTGNAYNGKLLWAVTVPSASASPTLNYDVTVTDENSLDVLAGAGANRHNVNTEYIAEASLGAVENSTLTINVSNAGSAKQGDLYLFIR